MKILILRHGIAEDRVDWRDNSKPDELRPLTKKGEQKALEAGHGLQKMVPQLTKVFTSPYTRATQTAEILERVYPNVPISILGQLAPNGEIKELKEFLLQFNNEDVLAFVGHSPNLNQLISYLLSGNLLSNIRLKKGGTAFLGIDLETPNPEFQLRWLLTQSQLCWIAKGLPLYQHL